MNGILQPHAAKSAGEIEVRRPKSSPVARIMPSGTPICG